MIILLASRTEGLTPPPPCPLQKQVEEARILLEAALRREREDSPPPPLHTPSPSKKMCFFQNQVEEARILLEAALRREREEARLAGEQIARYKSAAADAVLNLRKTNSAQNQILLKVGAAPPCHVHATLPIPL